MRNRILYEKHKTMVQSALALLDQLVTSVSIPWEVVSRIESSGGAGWAIGTKFATFFSGLILKYDAQIKEIAEFTSCLDAIHAEPDISKKS